MNIGLTLVAFNSGERCGFFLGDGPGILASKSKVALFLWFHPVVSKRQRMMPSAASIHSLHTRMYACTKAWARGGRPRALSWRTFCAAAKRPCGLGTYVCMCVGTYACMHAFAFSREIGCA